MKIGGAGKAQVALGVIRNGVMLDDTAPINRTAIELHNPVQDHLREYIDCNRVIANDLDIDVVPKHGCLGRSLAICGAGPSLRGARADTFSATQDIWAVNSALPYLVAAGVPVTAAFGIDQTARMIHEWADAPDVTYYVASSVDPDLVRHLKRNGRRVQFFHNHVGVGADEFQRYCDEWAPTMMVGEGWSAASRAIGLAMWMGYERVDLHGVDCCFTSDDIAHANGESAIDAYTSLSGERPAISVGITNGRTYRTRPDMLMDAVDLVRRVRKSEGRIRLIGDTLPVQLLGKSDDHLDLVCRRLRPGEALPQSA